MLSRDRVPETAVLRPRIGIQPLANTLGSGLVFLLPCLLEEHQKQVARQHIIQRVNLLIDDAVSADMAVDPSLNVIEMLLVVCPQIKEILAVEVERHRITPIP